MSVDVATRENTHGIPNTKDGRGGCGRASHIEIRDKQIWHMSVTVSYREASAIIVKMEEIGIGVLTDHDRG
jgi:hypothetical protein